MKKIVKFRSYFVDTDSFYIEVTDEEYNKLKVYESELNGAFDIPDEIDSLVWNDIQERQHITDINGIYDYIEIALC